MHRRFELNGVRCVPGTTENPKERYKKKSVHMERLIGNVSGSRCGIGAINNLFAIEIRLVPVQQLMKKINV